MSPPACRRARCAPSALGGGAPAAPLPRARLRRLPSAVPAAARLRLLPYLPGFHDLFAWKFAPGPAAAGLLALFPAYNAAPSPARRAPRAAVPPPTCSARCLPRLYLPCCPLQRCCRRAAPRAAITSSSPRTISSPSSALPRIASSSSRPSCILPVFFASRFMSSKTAISPPPVLFFCTRTRAVYQHFYRFAGTRALHLSSTAGANMDGVTAGMDGLMPPVFLCAFS